MKKLSLNVDLESVFPDILFAALYLSVLIIVTRFSGNPCVLCSTTTFLF